MNPEDAVPPNEKARLEALLEEDYYAFSTEGDCCCDFETVSVEGTGARRWYEGMYVVTRSDRTGEHFGWTYDSGLTEDQDDEYYSQPVDRVQPITKMVEVTEWELVK